MSSGILPDREIGALFASGALASARPLDHDQVQPASLDLRLGERAWRVRASFLPGPGHTVADKLDRLKLHEIDLAAGAVLETGCVYIVPLLESLALPKSISASANPKSSTGRLDIFTRVMTDHGQEFDKIPAGYAGPLYIEVSPRTFPIIARTGSRLSQIRFRERQCAAVGSRAARAARRRNAGRLRDAEHFRRRHRAVDRSFAAMATGWSAIAASTTPGWSTSTSAPRTTCSISGSRSTITARAELVLDPDEFYILVSREAVHVPPAYAAEMTPFDPLVGEFRVHYAGFFDPGFGHSIGRRHRLAEPCSKCAATRCRSSSSTARSSAAWSTSACARGRKRSTAPTSAPTTRRRA